MKKLFTLIITIAFATISFAQTANVEGNKDSLEKKLADNYVEFLMPKNTKTEEVEKSAQYYTEYFTVEFDEVSKKAKIKLIDMDPMARRVITRFLLSAGVRTINFDNQDYTIMEFYSNFLE